MRALRQERWPSLEPVPCFTFRLAAIRNFYRTQVYGLQIESERKTPIVVVFFTTWLTCISGAAKIGVSGVKLTERWLD
jgi:hypothetical protein